MAAMIAAATTAAACAPTREPELPAAPPFAQAADAVPPASTQDDPYRAVLDAEARDRRALRRDGPAGWRTVEYWVPETTTRAQIDAWYAKAAADASWRPDSSPPFGVDPAEPTAKAVWSLAYKAGARHLLVVGVERGPALKPVSGLIPLSVETDVPPPR